MSIEPGVSEGLSRRGLFGAGLGRALQAFADERPAGDTPPATLPPAFHGWTENDSTGLGPRVAAITADLFAACDVRAGRRVLVVAAGAGVIARAAAGLGAAATAVEADAERAARGGELCAAENLEVTWVRGRPTALPVEEASYDVVLSAFGASHRPDARTVAAAMTRAARPGAPIALTAWTGLMAAVLDTVGPHATGSPRWARYETAYRHFFDFPGLDVRDSTMRWTFPDREAAIEALGAPAYASHAHDRVVAALPALLGAYGEATADGLAVAMSYATIFARRP